MKKLLYAIVISAMLCGLCSCSKTEESSSSAADTTSATTEATTAVIEQTKVTTEKIVEGAVTVASETQSEVAGETQADVSETVAPQQTEKPKEAVFTADDMTFAFKGVSLTPDAVFTTETANKLGKFTLTSAPSCAYEGDDKIYEYSDFTIYTYPAGNADKILEIEIKGGGVSTKKGVKVGMATDAAIAVYGANYEIDGSSYKYSAGASSYMELNVSDNKVAYIRYVLAQ